MKYFSIAALAAVSAAGADDVGCTLCIVDACQRNGCPSSPWPRLRQRRAIRNLAWCQGLHWARRASRTPLALVWGLRRPLREHACRGAGARRGAQCPAGADACVRAPHVPHSRRLAAALRGSAHSHHGCHRGAPAQQKAAEAEARILLQRDRLDEAAVAPRQFDGERREPAAAADLRARVRVAECNDAADERTSERARALIITNGPPHRDTSARTVPLNT